MGLTTRRVPGDTGETPTHSTANLENVGKSDSGISHDFQNRIHVFHQLLEKAKLSELEVDSGNEHIVILTPKFHIPRGCWRMHLGGIIRFTECVAC